MAIQKLITFPVIIFAGILCCNCGPESDDDGFLPPVTEVPDADLPEVTTYLTTPNRSSEFALFENNISAFRESNEATIEINEATSFQEIDGFGFALTGGSALHLMEMSQAKRSELLNELFGNAANDINMNFIRISLGSSDLDPSVFTYNDDPDDPDHSGFDLGRDKENLLPVLKEIIAINPDIKILASPWSAPAWMKSNNSSVGGSLLQEYYDSYALYFDKYIAVMAEEGIVISHLTIQNEPLNPYNNPSMYMTAGEQTDFIRDHLGPLLRQNNRSVKIIAYDHNPDVIEYPLEVLEDTEAAAYIDGSAFHLYAGSITALSTVKNRFPEKNIYFTEQWFSASGTFEEDLKWHTREVVIGSLRNWSRCVIEWNLTSDLSFDPHTDGGCDSCKGGLTLTGNNVVRNAGYFVISHASKLIVPGSRRIQSSLPGPLPNVAFITPANEIVLLVLNNSDRRQTFNITQGESKFATALDEGAVATYKWKLND
ncbi:MAG: glycoside hydrolase family 30 beta sandwich domain-containing protein [Cyclobacteriaceae bacterium]